MTAIRVFFPKIWYIFQFPTTPPPSSYASAKAKFISSQKRRMNLFLTELLLFGKSLFDFEKNSVILKTSIDYILSTESFQESLL